jgi:hypothetical protein
VHTYWHLFNNTVSQTILVATRSKTWVCGHSLGLWVQILPEALMLVPCAGCVLSGRGPCDRPIPHPEKFYYVCARTCVCVSLSVIMCNGNRLHLQWVGRKRWKQETMKNIFSLPCFMFSHHTVDLMFLYTFYQQLSGHCLLLLCRV